ncbi:MAG: DNA segregation ATPase FtsK/SpoIIIE-like protein [Phenylobacterium sp.]|jgi:DNA segregation ATPase FtsK/SpoIIIE-like protein
MVITMSSHASDKPKAYLHQDFYKPPIVKTDNQNTVDFFRVWLLDEPGKNIIKRFLEEKISFDEQKALKTITFMEKAINRIDQQAQRLCTQQQAIFVNQYNERQPEHQKANSYQQIQVDREAVLSAEAVIQSKLNIMAENSVIKLGKSIGRQSVADINSWISNYLEQPALPPIDPEQYLKEVSEDLNYIHQ